MEKNENSKKKNKITNPRALYPRKKTDRILITGFHPDDPNKRIYNFWASKFLMDEYPCVGDKVLVRSKYGRRCLCVTDVQQWKPGMYEPNKIARKLYEGEKFKDWEPDPEELENLSDS